MYTLIETGFKPDFGDQDRGDAMPANDNPIEISTPLGFIGLGAMGLPMSRCLAAQGYALSVSDPAPEARRRAAAIEGISVASSAQDAAAASALLFTCLPNDAVLRSVYLGDEGLAAALNEGTITIDCSTVSPGVTREIHDSLAERGVRHLDAAMLGSVPQAETGEIGFVIGGPRGAFERAAPLFDVLGRFRTYAGASGAGNRIKLIHQTLVACNAVAVAEAVALCLATDTDLDSFYDVVCNGGGMAYSRYFENRIPRMRAGNFDPLFALAFMKKDVGLAHDLAKATGFHAPILEQVMARYMEASEAGWDAEDFSAVAHLYERALGRPFGPANDA